MTVESLHLTDPPRADDLGGLRLGLAGPVSVADLQPFVDVAGREWQSPGSPLLTTLIGEYLRRGLQLSVYTCDASVSAARGAPSYVRLEAGPLRVFVVPRRSRAYRFNEGRPGRIIDFFAVERAALRQAMVDDDAALVHAHWSYEYGAAALDSGRPTLLTCHDSPRAILGTMPDMYRLGRLWMARSVLARARAVTVVSPYLVDELRGSLRVVPEVVPNPLPDTVLESGRFRACPHAAAPTVGLVLNGWGPRKNAPPAMQALAALYLERPGLRIEMVGPGFGPGQQAHQWAAERGVADRFVFVGQQPHDSVIHRMAGWDLLVHPAVEESFGLSIAEAMGLGLPVVAGASSGAVPWVVGDQAGSLVDVRSSTAIHDAIAGLLDDSQAYAAASRAGRARAQVVFSAAAVADAYVARYRALVGAVPALGTSREVAA